MKKLCLAIGFVSLVALSPAPIKDPRTLHVSPELSDAQRQEQQRGVRLGEVGSVPADTERLPVPSIDGSDEASNTVRDASKGGNLGSDSARKGAAAIQEASRDLARHDKPNWGRLFAGGLIIIAAFGLFQVFRMWANKSLPDAPTTYR